MLWVLFAILTTVIHSVDTLLSKRLIRDFDEYTLSWSLRFFAALCLIPLLFFVDIPPLGKHFWIALFLAGISVTVTTILVMKSVKYSDLSKVAPLAAFTPLFLLVTSPLILHEIPSLVGIGGVVLIVVGSYILNIHQANQGYEKPFKALITEKGPRYMLLVSFIWALGSDIDKIGVQNSSPLFWTIMVNSIAVVMLSPFLFSQKSSSPSSFSIPKTVLLVLLGVSVAVGLLFQMLAINLAQVAYVIAIKRTSILLTVFLSVILFKERGGKERLVAAAIMVLGVLLITLS